jgi:hypothetical protein
VEMPGSWKAWKSKNSFSPLPTPPWKSRQKARDSHIPTATRRPGWKSGKPPTGFPLSHAGRATTATVYLYSESKPRNKIGLFAASLITLSQSPCIGNACHIKKHLARRVPTRYNKLSPGRGSLAGFEVTLYGRF